MENDQFNPGRRKEDKPDIEAQWLHHVVSDLDSRTKDSERAISGLRGEISQVNQQLTAQGAVLHQIADKVNAPSTFNVWAMISSIAGLCVLFAGFVALTNTPQEQAIRMLQETDRTSNQWRREQEYAAGYQQAQIDQIEKTLNMILGGRRQ